MKQYLIESYEVGLNDLIKNEAAYKSLTESSVLHEGKSYGVLGIFEAPLSRLGKLNKNNRLYNESTWKDPLSRGDGEGSYGLINHPKAGESPNMHDVYCIWRNHRIEKTEEGPIVKGTLYLLNNDNGKLVNSILEAGGKIELSTRGYGELSESNVVYDYQFDGSDCVFRGSYGVSFTKDEKIESTPITTQITESEKPVKIESSTTNNKIELLGENAMLNKLMVKRMISESLKEPNKFKAYRQLEELVDSLSEDENMKDELVAAEAAKEQVGAAVEKQGDPMDNGTADEPGAQVMNGTDPEKKIQDVPVAPPRMVQSIKVDPAVTPTTERGGQIETKPFAAGAAAYEVKSGEILPGMIKEDTTEDPPAMVDPITVDPAVVDNVADRPGQTDTVPFGKKVGVPEVEKGTSEIELVQGAPTADKPEEEVDVSKMSESELRDLAVNLSEALNAMQGELGTERKLFEKLSEQYLKLEQYTMKAERVVEFDKVAKEKAQTEVMESVEMIKAYKLENATVAKKVAQLEAYAKTLEDKVLQESETKKVKGEVIKYLQEVFVQYPQLTAFRKEISTATSIQEANELVQKYASMKGKIRVDKVLRESIESAPVKKQMSEERIRMKAKGFI